jgi:hypothetical protein
MRDTIYMAREAGFKVGPSRDGPDEVRGAGVNLKWFEALVRADEREACAVIAETPISGEQDDITMQAKDRVAAAIRARGQA